MIADTKERQKRGETDGLADAQELVFRISCLQILDEHGELLGPEPDLSPEQLTELYGAMLLGRAVDDRLLKLQRQGRVGTFPPSTGQEAVSCGVALAMRPKDWFVGAFRELGGRLMRGEPIENVFLAYNGREEGNWFEGGERVTPLSIIIASHMLHAVGIAYAARLRGEKDTAVVTFVGDGGTSQGDFHEALNFAACWQVPVVFICQNNQWAISLPRSKQTHSRTLAQKAIAFDIPGIQVDGNDALAMYQVARDALERARSGGGPTFIEAVTYRLRMHTTADDPKKYQPEELLQKWEKREPLLRFRKYLEKKNLWNDDKQAELEAAVKQRVDAAVKSFEADTDFRMDEPFDHVYGTKHPRIEQQRAEFLDNFEKDAAEIAARKKEAPDA